LQPLQICASQGLIQANYARRLSDEVVLREILINSENELIAFYRELLWDSGLPTFNNPANSMSQVLAPKQKFPFQTGSLTGKLMLVRHGPGRGPAIRLRAYRPRYFDPLLKDFALREPELRSHICVWETGTPLPDLEDVRAILFLLQDPTRECFPECYADGMRLASQAKTRGIRLVNPPNILSNSIKSTQASLWQAAGMPVPRQFAFKNREEFEQAVSETTFPAILRSDVLHAQVGMVFCDTPEEAVAAANRNLPLPGTLSEFVDTRNDFRNLMPGTVWADFYHKKRAFVFGNRVRTNHTFFGTHPIVGSLSCSFDHYRSLNPWRRWKANRACRKHIELDLEYFRKGTENEKELVAAANALGMEFAAIDYSSKANGDIVLWEANPHFCIHAWPFQVLARPRKLADRMLAFHDSMAYFFKELLQGSEDA
jgi:hypothetical protein